MWISKWHYDISKPLTMEVSSSYQSPVVMAG